ncbi:MAG: iron-containing alcohol dehydrogenase [Propionicimonas sp.]|uniref:iron-containing alcohol dehydrogenase n=1 Tax=Propionicimonas sp. TaxID=1955623 RepID=UPI002B21FF61|nr:iron-containing alcohol dehydrogenase [Propionicimonas sp.]MEA4944081.1 iron-containing alcohol dehydrogenase [Propionicimonas sp.]
MLNFNFATAGRILFGAGRVSELPGIVAGLGERPFVCTGSNPARHQAILDALPGATAFGVAGEPSMDVVRAGAEAARAHRADVVIGLGGGAVLDAAKVIAALVTSGGDPMDYAEVIGRGQPLAVPSLPVVAVPTTAGTGSEVTANGVVTSTEHQVKVSLRSASMLPVVALLDPELTLGVPPATTAHSGLDALVQCIEPFVSPFATPVTDGFCREGIKRAATGLRRAYADGSDLAARTDMCVCSLFGGLALANAKLGAAHGIAGPAGGMLGAPHGAITASVMVAVSRANIEMLRETDPSSPALDRYAEVGELLTGTRDVQAYLDWFAETVALLGVSGLAALGMTDDQVEPIAQAASVASSTKGNPVRLSVEQFAEILRASR